MSGHREDLLARFGVPEFGRSVVAARDKHVAALVERAVRQRLLVGLQLLEDCEVLVLVRDDFVLQF